MADEATPTPAPAVDPAAPAVVPAASIVTQAVAPPVENTPAAEPKSLAETLYPDKDAKPAAEAAPTTNTKPEGETAPTRTPEDYTLTLPEGFKPDDELLNGFKGAAAEANLDPAVAQKFADLAAQLSEKQAAFLLTSQNAQRQTWLDETMKLPWFANGNDKQSLNVLGRVLDEFGTPQTREALVTTGADNHPAIVSLIMSMAHALIEGEPVASGRPVNTRNGQSLGQRLYGDSPHAKDMGL